MGIRIEGIHHHSVVVADLDRGRAFYRDVLGLEEIPAPPALGSVAWFALGDGQQLHLLRAGQAEAPGQRHIALHTADTDAARRRLRELGQRVEDAGGIPGADRFFTADPDGNRIELIRWSVPWAASAHQLGLQVRGAAR